jgi:RNA polymerase sigma factor (sigma-70 family)
LTEQELLTALCNGEEPAFKELVTRFQDRVFNTALGLLQHVTDAEDIAQEVFIQVYRSIHQFKGDALLSTWIYRITVTKSLDLLRSKKRKKRFGYVSSIFGNDNRLVHEPGDFNHPGIQQERKEDAALLFKMVDELPENQRTAFILNKVEELSYREIADILKTTESAVDSLLQRAKQNLRKKLSQKINNSP